MSNGSKIETCLRLGFPLKQLEQVNITSFLVAIYISLPYLTPPNPTVSLSLINY